MKSVYPALTWKSALYFLQATARPLSCNQYCSPNYSVNERKQCLAECCADGKTQTCTPGSLDAGAAVAAAKKAQSEGLPKVALIDAEKYLIKLSIGPEKTWEGMLKLQNVGGAKGTYILSSRSPQVIFAKSQITIEAGATASVSFHIAHEFVDSEREFEIRVASPQSGINSSFTDEMVLFAQK